MYQLMAFCEPMDDKTHEELDIKADSEIDQGEHEHDCLEVKCPKCQQVQDVKLLGNVTKHSCTTCGVQGVIRFG
jgi:hypothetical protein